MSKATIKAAWIGGVCTLIGAVIGGAFQNGCNNKSQERDAVHQETDSGSNYNAGRDNIQPGSGSTVVSANDSSKVNITINSPVLEKKSPIKPVSPLFNDQSVKSYYQSGGITARDVTVNV